MANPIQEINISNNEIFNIRSEWNSLSSSQTAVTGNIHVSAFFSSALPNKREINQVPTLTWDPLSWVWPLRCRPSFFPSPGSLCSSTWGLLCAQSIFDTISQWNRLLSAWTGGEDPMVLLGQRAQEEPRRNSTETTKLSEENLESNQAPEVTLTSEWRDRFPKAITCEYTMRLHSFRRIWMNYIHCTFESHQGCTYLDGTS